MMSLETIRDLAREQARIARRAKKEPFVVQLSDLESYRTVVENGSLPRLPFPNIGSYKPPGWTETRRLFVDKSGFGQEGEPALTIKALINRELKADHGYAIVEEGQFQLYLGEFLPKKRRSS